MNHHLFCATLKDNAKERLTGHYGLLIGSQFVVSCITVVAAFILSAFIAVPITQDSSLFISTILTHASSLLVGSFAGVFQVGLALLYLKFACGNPNATLSDIFYGFRNQFQTALGISFVISLVTVIPSFFAEMLLNVLAVAGSDAYLPLSLICDLGVQIIATLLSLFLFPCYYLMLDFPGKTIGEILRMSLNIMKGQKGKLLYIILSFIPLQILCTISIIGGFWVEPYLLMTQALFFFEIMKKENVVK